MASDAAGTDGRGPATPGAWERVVHDHSARVYRLAYRLSGDAQDAADLTRETFVQVFRSPSGPAPGGPEAPLHRITTGLFLDLVERRQQAGTPAGPGAGTGPRLPVQAALDALPPEVRVPVVLRDVAGLPYDEIAATLGIGRGAVGGRIHRGRAGLRRCLPAPPRDRAVADRPGRSAGHLVRERPGEQHPS
ncbi:sigma factor-like helix-turn-helix DNA-binding protein [Geodermatophilus sp. SYSU D00710]